MLHKFSLDAMRKLAVLSGISLHTLKEFRAGRRWPSAETALLIEEYSEETLGEQVRCGDVCPACAGCPYYIEGVERERKPNGSDQTTANTTG